MDYSKTITSEKSLEEMLNDCSIDAIMAIDTEKNLIAWNTIAEKIHGRKKYEVIGKPLLEIIPSTSEDEETLQAVNLAFKGIKSFVPASRKYYHRMHAENHFIPLKENDGRIIGVMNIVHDVAHRIKAEEELQRLNDELEKRFRQLKLTSDELASFTYLTSNKIKEPIRQIYTGIEFLIKTEAGRLTDTGKASFRRIQSSLNRMDLLLNDVLSLSKISILQIPDTEVNLNEIVNQVITDMKNKLEESNAVVNIGSLCIIQGDKDYLYLLFHNIIDNAVKFNTSPQPMIKIDCKKTSFEKASHELLDEPGYYCINITDNGIGFENNDAEKIFIMFEKLNASKYKGSGMGLTVARKIMDAHNGFLQVESVPGDGSIFHCYFPID